MKIIFCYQSFKQKSNLTPLFAEHHGRIPSYMLQYNNFTLRSFSLVLILCSVISFPSSTFCQHAEYIYIYLKWLGEPRFVCRGTVWNCSVQLVELRLVGCQLLVPY